MLFVKNYQAQICENDLVLYKRLGTDNKLCLTRLDCRHGFATGFCTEASGKTRYSYTQRIEPLRQFPKMLLRQNLFGRHHSQLSVVAYDMRSDPCIDNGLAIA